MRAIVYFTEMLFEKEDRYKNIILKSVLLKIISLIIFLRETVTGKLETKLGEITSANSCLE